MDLFKKGTYADTPYSNFFEIKARNLEKKLVNMSDYEKKVLLLVNVSPFDPNFKEEFQKLNDLKLKYKNEPFEILAFPCSQLDKKELTDQEMKSKIEEVGKLNFNIFNRVSLNFKRNI